MAVVLALVSAGFAAHKLYPQKLSTRAMTLVKTLSVAKVEAEKPQPDAPLAKVQLPKAYDAILLGEVNAESTAKFVKDVAAAADHPQVTVRITSPGGSAGSMLMMIQGIEDLKKQKHFKLVCVADIMAASAAYITLETSCDTRLMTYRTILLAHGVQGSSSETNIATRADDLHESELLERMVSVAVAKRMGMTTEEYLQWIYGRNRWMGPEEAMQRHAIDGIIDPADAPAGTVGDTSDQL